ncbi:MAG: hypothetical protein ACREIG_08460, partial [Nitrospiraceae bacterium]
PRSQDAHWLVWMSAEGSLFVATPEGLKWVGYRLLDILVAYRPGAGLHQGFVYRRRSPLTDETVNHNPDRH